jgi:nucleoporin NUP42
MVRAGAPSGPGKGPQLQRIWFPDGPPAYTAETEVKAEEYDEESKREWAGFMEKGAFVSGKMPLMPPLREFCRWDF